VEQPGVLAGPIRAICGNTHSHAKMTWETLRSRGSNPARAIYSIKISKKERPHQNPDTFDDLKGAFNFIYYNLGSSRFLAL